MEPPRHTGKIFQQIGQQLGDSSGLFQESPQKNKHTITRSATFLTRRVEVAQAFLFRRPLYPHRLLPQSLWRVSMGEKPISVPFAGQTPMSACNSTYPWEHGLQGAQCCPCQCLIEIQSGTFSILSWVQVQMANGDGFVANFNGDEAQAHACEGQCWLTRLLLCNISKSLSPKSTFVDQRLLTGLLLCHLALGALGACTPVLPWVGGMVSWRKRVYQHTQILGCGP